MLLALATVLSCLYPAIVIPLPAVAQTVPAPDAAPGKGLLPAQAAPVNPQFAAYQQARLSRGPALLQAMATTGPAPGLVPAPVDLSFLKGSEVDLDLSGELPDTYVPEGVDLLGDSGDSYDLRTLGRLTGVRDQGSSGSCWAFATYASLESYLMPAQVADFSENNLKNTHGFDVGPNSGGNEFMSAAYLTRWAGPVDEADDPYVETSLSSPVLPADMHVQEVLFIPDRANSTDNGNLKQAIQAYGAVYTACYWGASYYNAATHAYYYNSTGANHAIALVGWNDSYSRSNFASAPPGDGAFIARNSWGEDWGEGGYFYISYYDRIVGTSNAVFTAEATGNYDHVYQHDPLGWTGNAGYGSDVAWFAASYTAGSNESLSAVGFYTPQVNSDYQLNIYRDDTLNRQQSGAFGLPGYHTVTLDTPVTLGAGQTFRVEVRLHTPGYNYPVCIESRISGYTSGATSNASESFVSGNGVAWSDIGADSQGNPTNTDVCLKVYTEDADTVIESTPPVPPSWPTLTFSGQSFTAGENAGTVAITVVREGSTVAPASVSYAVTGGNATPGTDYTGGSGTVTIASGATDATFSLAIVNDAVYEGNETVVLSLSDPVNATLGSPNSTTVIIRNDDAAPVLRFGAAQYSGAESAGKITIPVSLSGGTAFPASVSYAVTGGNATAGTDYTGGSGTLTFAPGNATAYFDLSLVNDAAYEGNETVTLTLSNPKNATIGTPSATTATIINDDAPPAIRFSLAQNSVNENAGTLPVQVTLTGSTSLAASISYAVTGGNATAGTDYTGGSGNLTFAPGTTTASFNLNILNDAVDEDNETIILTLSSPKNATTGTPASTTITITDEDAQPTLRFAAATYTVAENAGAATVTVNLTGSTALPVSVNYSVTGGNATAGTDYTGGAGTLTFAPGTTTASFNVNILNDAMDENDETIVFTLSNPKNASTGTPASTTITITDNDAQPTLRFAAATYTVAENAGAATITVSLSGSTSKPVSVNYSVSGGSAIAGTDYTGGSGMLSFTPGVTSASFSVSLINDAAYRGNRTITLSLGNLKNATAGTPSSTTITIMDDELPTTVETYNYTLVSGWNLISIPLTLQDNSITGIFPADVRAGIVNIWGWDEDAQNWVYYCPDSGDYFYEYYPALTALETGKAYWVEMNRTATVSVQGTVPAGAPASPAALVDGWNFVGLTGETSSSPAAMYPDAVTVWGWDAAAQNWVYYCPDPDDYFYEYYPEITGILPGRGYWVEMA
ncbi:MAG: Calx-beta domain protein [Methanocella sp. PtaU1.Bin125]|nr:MAG: Calx-beta domain protein [Methanocella sp. PtaU1.Bin125]